MRVVMISTDRNMFDRNSPVAERMISYGEVFGELHIIVFSLRQLSAEPFSLSEKVFIYPTQSSSRLSYIRDAVTIGQSIISNIYFGQTVISAQDPFETGIAGILLKRKTKVPLQMQIHTDFHSKGFYDSSLLNWTRFQLARFTLKHADGVRVVREKIKRDLTLFYSISALKITTLPIFIDINRMKGEVLTVDLKKKYSQFKKIVLSVSRLSSEKNIETVIRAFAQAQKHVSDMGLVIVGEGVKRSSLEALVKQLDLSSSVVFEGWHNELSSFYKTADLFVNASFFEGYGMSLVEAAALGCPILTSSVGIAQDILKDGRSALICEENTVNCFTNKMVNFFTNYSIQKTIADRAFQEIKSLSLSHEEYLKKYFESLSSIVNKI